MNIGRRTFAFSAASLLAFPATAQEAWPARPVTLVVPYPPGNAADISGRILLEPLSTEIGQRLVIDNRAGASGIMGSAAVARSAPNGYTLLLTSNSPIASGPWVTKNVPYVVERDFTPIAGVARGALVLLAASDVPVSTTAEFVAYVKANPGKLNQGNNSSVSFQTEDLFNRLGISLERIPYKGGPAAIQAVMANEVQFYTSAPQDVLQLASQGRVRILAYTEKQRHPLLSEVPTTFESAPAAGDYEARFWFALIGPGGMSAPLVNFINAEMLEFVRTPEVRERLASLGLKTYNSTPDDVRKEFTTMAGQVETVMARGIKLR